MKSNSQPSAQHSRSRKRAGTVVKKKVKWWVYLVRCRGGAIYTGIATDVERRVGEHNAGTGSKALRGQLPVKLIYFEKSRNRSAAQRREAEIKRWPSAKKLVLAGLS
jgi:putative endonuclease